MSRKRRPKPPKLFVGEVCCARCGYNLKGLELHKRCPECDLHIPESLRGRSVFPGPPEFGKRVKHGLLLALIGDALVAPAIVLCIAGFLLYVVLNQRSSTPPAMSLLSVATSVPVLVVALAGLIVGLIGWKTLADSAFPTHHPQRRAWLVILCNAGLAVGVAILAFRLDRYLPQLLASNGIQSVLGAIVLFGLSILPVLSLFIGLMPRLAVLDDVNNWLGPRKLTASQSPPPVRRGTLAMYLVLGPLGPILFLLMLGNIRRAVVRSLAHFPLGHSPAPVPKKF